MVQMAVLVAVACAMHCLRQLYMFASIACRSHLARHAADPLLLCLLLFPAGMCVTQTDKLETMHINPTWSALLLSHC
jgi:hypothetical protein